MSKSIIPAQADHGYMLRSWSREANLPLVCSQHHHPPLSSPYTEGKADVGPVGYHSTTHQSCLTSPAVPVVLLIILSTGKNSYWTSIMPLNVILIYYNTLHLTTVIPATVIPFNGLVSFPPRDQRHSCLLEDCLHRLLGLCLCSVIIF